MCGNRLRVLRLQANKTLEQVAAEMNIAHPTVSRYENGKRKMDPETIIKFCKYYNVSADYILGLPEDLPYPKD